MMLSERVQEHINTSLESLPVTVRVRRCLVRKVVQELTGPTQKDIPAGEYLEQYCMAFGAFPEKHKRFVNTYNVTLTPAVIRALGKENYIESIWKQKLE